MSSNLPGQHVHTIQLDSRCSCGQQAPLRWCRPDKFRKPVRQGLSLHSIRRVCRCLRYTRCNGSHSRPPNRCRCPPCRFLCMFRHGLGARARGVFINIYNSRKHLLHETVSAKELTVPPTATNVDTFAVRVPAVRAVPARGGLKGVIEVPSGFACRARTAVHRPCSCTLMSNLASPAAFGTSFDGCAIGIT